MNHHLLSGIGHRLRQLRRANTITLTDLANRAGVSKSLLSKIENGRTLPSLPVLMHLIQALGLYPEDFFRGLRTELPTKYIHRPAAAATPIKKEKDAKGFHYRLLFEQAFKHFSLQAVLLDIEPGSEHTMVSVEALEFKFLLKGHLQYQIEEEVITLQPGDSLFYDGRLPHVPRNEGTETAQVLVLSLFNQAES